MGVQESLSRLMDRMADNPHVYHPSILSFLQLDVKKIAKDLRLCELGKERGERDEPPSDDEAFDAVENEVLEVVEGEVRKAHANLLDDLAAYAQRLHALDLEGRFSAIEVGLHRSRTRCEIRQQERPQWTHLGQPDGGEDPGL